MELSFFTVSSTSGPPVRSRKRYIMWAQRGFNSKARLYITERWCESYRMRSCTLPAVLSLPSALVLLWSIVCVCLPSVPMCTWGTSMLSLIPFFKLTTKEFCLKNCSQAAVTLALFASHLNQVRQWKRWLSEVKFQFSLSWDFTQASSAGGGY